MKDKNGRPMLALWTIMLPEDYRVIVAKTRAYAAEEASVPEDVLVRMKGCWATGKARVIK